MILARKLIKYFNKELVLHEESLEWLKKYLKIDDEYVLEANKNKHMYQRIL